MADPNSSLFRWRRLTEPHKPSSNYKSEYSDHQLIDDWLENINLNQQAELSPFAHLTGDIDLSAYDYMQDDDSAQAQAKEILDNWVNEKFTGETPIVDEDYSHIQEGYYDAGFPVLGDDIDENTAVQKILDELLQKPLENKAFKDLGLDRNKKSHDPMTRMNIRQQQMKKKWEARRKKEATAKEIANNQVQAYQDAKKIINHEERERLARVRREEQEVNREMVRIRKLMREQERTKEEKRERTKHAEMEAVKKVEEDLERERIERLAADEERRRIQQQQVVKRKKLIGIKGIEAKRSLKTLRRHFSAWYAILAEKHLRIGKIRAIADFRFKLKVWNAWRSYIRNVTAERETRAFQRTMQTAVRKEQIGMEHWRTSILQRCFLAWYHWSRITAREKLAKREHEAKQKKMAAFLEAAATGKLWSKDSRQDNLAKTSNASFPEDDYSNLKYEIATVPDNAKEVVQRNTGRSKVQESYISKNQRKDANVLNENCEPKAAWSRSKAARKRIKAESAYGPVNRKTHYDRTAIEEFDNGERPLFAKASRNANVKTTKIQDDVKVENVENTDDEELRDEFNEPEVVKVVTNKDVEFSSNQEIQDSRKEEQLFTKQTDDLVGGIAIVDDQNNIKPSIPENSQTKVDYKNLSRETDVVKKKRRILQPPALLAMDQRALERAERKRIVEEKKRLQEEERLTKLKLQEEQQRLQEQLEKQNRVEKFREEKRKLKQKELEKQQRIEYMAKINYQAELYRYRKLLTNYGLLPMRKLVEISKKNYNIAANFELQQLQKRVLLSWHTVAENQKLQKEAVADDYYCMIIVRKYYDNWIKYVKHEKLKDAMTIKHLNMRLLKSCMEDWKKFTHEELLFQWEKDRRARKHDQRRLKMVVMNKWREFVPYHRKEKEKNRRKLELRRKVSQWLPDFAGQNNSDDEIHVDKEQRINVKVE